MQNAPAPKEGASCADPEGGSGFLDPPPPPPPHLKNHKNIGFLSNACPDPLKNLKATKPAFNFGPFKWRFAGRPMMGPFIAVFGASIPLSTKKNKNKTLSNLDPLRKNFLDPCMGILQYFQPSLSYQLSLKPLFCLFLSGRFTQVLLYYRN